MTGDQQHEYREWIEQDGSFVDRAARIATTWVWDYIFRLKAYGSENIPTEGGFILAPNHASYIDPFIHLRRQPRVIRFLAKAELFSMPVIGRMVRAKGCIPIQRGQGDSKAIEITRRVLEQGHPVVVYAEGTRFRTDDKLGPAKRGMVRLAIEAGVPIIPAAAWGNKPRKARGESWFPPCLPKVTVVYGEPIEVAHRELDEAGEIRDEVWSEVHRLYAIARQIGSSRKRRPKSSWQVPTRDVAESRELTKRK